MVVRQLEKAKSANSSAESAPPSPRGLGKASQRLAQSGKGALREPADEDDADQVQARPVDQPYVERPADELMDAASQNPPNFDQVNELLHHAPPEEQRELLEQLAEGDAEELMRALGGEDVTDEQRTLFFEELSDMADDFGDPELLDQLGQSLAAGLDEELSEEVAEAVKQSLANGSNAGLSVSLARHVEGQVADVLADKMSEGFHDFYAEVQQVGDEVARLDGDLAYLVQSFGPMMSEEELAAAIEDYRAQHPEYARLERMGGSAVANLEHVEEFGAVVDASVTDQGLRDEIHGETNLEDASWAAAPAVSTEGGQRALGDLLAREGAGEETWLGRMQECAPGYATRPEFLDALFTTGVSQAAAAAADGDPERAQAILQGIGATGGMLGLHGEQADLMTAELQSVLEAAGSGDSQVLNAALGQFDAAIDGLGDALSMADISRLRGAGAGLGVAGLGVSGVELAAHPSFQNLAAFMVNGTELAADLPQVQAMLESVFGAGGATAARVAGGVGVLMSIWDAGQSFSEGDVGAGLLNLGGALGGYLVAAGSTGVGLLVSGVASLGLVGLEQWREAQASNHFENNPGTELFLREALSDSGLSGEELDAAVTDLKDSAGSGRLNGILIQQAADQLGMDPGALLNLLVQVPHDTLQDIMVQGHAVQPSDEDDLTSLPTNEVAIWVNYLRQQGVPIPC